MKVSGMGDWMGSFLHACVQKEQGNSELFIPELLWFNSGNEATLGLSEEVLIEGRNFNKVGDIRTVWEGYL